MAERIFVCYLPFGPVGMTAEELTDFGKVPDNQGLRFYVETADPEEDHVCSEDTRASRVFTQIMASDE